MHFISPNFDTLDYTIEEIFNEDMIPIEKANQAQMTFKMRINLPLQENDIMRLKVFDK